MTRKYIAAIILILAPCIASAQITLEEYCDRVMAYSQELLDKELATQGARSEELAARKGYLPIFDLAREMNIDMRSPAVGRRWSWLSRLDVSQPVFRGGAVRANVKQAELSYDIAELGEEDARRFVRYTAEIAYWSLSRAENYYAAMGEYVDIVRSLRDVVSERYNEGYISKSDLLQVESRLSDAEYQLSSAMQSRDIARHNFNMLCGVEPAASVILAQSILNEGVMPVRMGVDAILEHHPTYKASQLEVERSFWGVRAAQARFLPQIEVGAYALLQPVTPHVKGGDLRLDGGVFFSFSTPIYHFSERKHVVSAARSKHLRQVNALSNEVDRITLEESDAWSNLSSTHDRVQTIKQNLSLAKENLSISTYSYHEGLSTILDVLQAQLSWLQIYTNAIAAQYDYAVAISAYRYVVCVW